MADAAKRSNRVVLVVWGVIGLLVLVFVLNNSQTVELSLAFRTVGMPVWLLVLVFFGLGLAAGWVTRWWTGRG
jgi:uncharacterized integral membrane protein